MSKDIRDNPYSKIRKPTAKGIKVIQGGKYNKTKIKNNECKEIEEGIEDYLNRRAI